MPDNENYLDLSDFTGLLIDNTLSALIKSLESQVQWREQISALDRMTDEEIFANLSEADIDDWLEESNPELIPLFERWKILNIKGKEDIRKEADLIASLKSILNEIGTEVTDVFDDQQFILTASNYETVSDNIKSHLMKAAKHRLSMMKEMGLPALVAEKVEIKSKMNLMSSVRQQASERSSEISLDKKSAKAAKKRDKINANIPLARRAVTRSADHRSASKIASPVKAQIVGKLTDLEKIRSKIPVTNSHSIQIAATPLVESANQQTVNAEITITLRSHFF